MRLKKVNLSWNGFGAEGGVAIADALVTNNSLQEIDISGNRLNAECAVRTAKAITCNDNIRILRVSCPNSTFGRAFFADILVLIKIRLKSYCSFFLFCLIPSLIDSPHCKLKRYEIYQDLKIAR